MRNNRSEWQTVEDLKATPKRVERRRPQEESRGCRGLINGAIIGLLLAGAVYLMFSGGVL